MSQTLSRRRFIGIAAATAGLALPPFGGALGAQSGPVRWRGSALGAPAEMVLNHPDRAAAERLLVRAVAEIARLEDIFSLYRETSALSTLNRLGALAAPPPELVELLDTCRRFHAMTSGFDPSVQPLWQLHARHFAAPGADPAGPSADEIAAALALVGFEHVAFNRDRIAFARRGMALTLNGIAQGFITDRIVDLLRAGGAVHTLADIGEIRAIGPRADGTPWRVGIAGKAATLDFADMAVATSSPDGFRFGGPGTPGHILDPATGRAAARYASVSVVAADATTADALSTAFGFMAPEDISTALKTLPAVEAHLFLPDGRRLSLG